MSGHSDFSRWLKLEAKFVIVEQEKIGLKDIYFKSDGGNAEMIVYRLENGQDVTIEDVDIDDLLTRFREYMSRPPAPLKRKRRSIKNM